MSKTALELFEQGYYPLSNKYRIVARIDRPDWVTWMAGHYRRAPADFYVHESGKGPTSNTGRWGEHYCSVFSKDKIEDVDPIVYGDLKRLWNQSASVVEYVNIGPGTKFQVPLAWTREMPTEPGWYWIRHPSDNGAANLRHLSWGHGQWHFEGRLSSEVPRGYSSKEARIDVMWMTADGCEFYGPLQVPV